jgi:hypothetical protein
VRLKHSGKQGGGQGGLCPVGEHPAEVEDERESVSKSGNDMLVLTFRVLDRWRVEDYLVLDNERVQWRLDRLVEVFGEVDSSELVGRRCLVRIEHEVGDDGIKRAKVKGLRSEDEGGEDQSPDARPGRAPDATRPAGRGLPPQAVPGTDDSDLPF